MAKSKHSPALYELIAKQGARGKSPFDHPPAVAPDSTHSEPEPELEPEPEQIVEPPPVVAEPPPQVVEVPMPAPVQTSAAAAVAEPEPDTAAPPGRIGRFFRDPTNVAGMITLVAIVALAAGFARSRGLWGGAEPARGPGTVAEAMEKQPQPEVLRILGVVPAGQQRRVAPPTEKRGSNAATAGTAPANEPKRLVDDAGRTVGLNYVIVESFKADAKDDAAAAVAFLAQNGVSATIERSGSGWIVVSRYGYDYRDPKLDALTKRILALGEKYSKQGGRYRFQCYAKKYKGSW